MMKDDLTRETQEIWNAKAEFWDARMGEGNAFHRLMIGPAAERLLDLQAGELVLDVACGNGQFSRRMAVLGARVVATDFSSRFLELARAREKAGEAPEGRIEYRQIDATDESQLLTLGKGRFDAAVCNMALMDMPEIEPLLQALTMLLKPRGRFVFTIQHPAFNSSNVRMLAEDEDRNGSLVMTHWLKVSRYLHLPPSKGCGMPDEPAPHYYFHRPLSEVLGTCFRNGFVMDGIEEPAFLSDERKHLLSWENYPDIPPIFAARMRLR